MTTPPNNPLLRAFFMGRAVAEVLSETAEKALTEALSELGKFDAEQRVNVRTFIEQVNQRAETAMGQTQSTDGLTNGFTTSGFTTSGFTTGNSPATGSGADLQATIDDLRAEIAEVRTELQRYRTTLN